MFMIFGDIAVNLALVQTMREDFNCVTLTMHDGSHVIADATTIADILTAQAAGQSRVASLLPSPSPGKPDHSPSARLQPSISERRSKRFREPERNDPQAMRSIGRQ